MYIMLACVSVNAPWACRSRQRASEPPDTGVVKHLLGTEDWTQVLCESRKYSELLSNLCRPFTVFETVSHMELI